MEHGSLRQPSPLREAPNFANDSPYKDTPYGSQQAQVQPKHRFRMPRVLARRGGKAGRPPRNIRPHFTPEQMETAVQVVMYSKVIYNWVISEAEFLGIDLNSLEGKGFFRKNAREAAIRLLK